MFNSIPKSRATGNAIIITLNISHFPYGYMAIFTNAYKL